MTGFFNSNKSAYRAIRRQSKYGRIFSGAQGGSGSNNMLLTKKEQEKIDLGFTGYSIKYGNIAIVGNIETMLPQFQHDIDADNHNLLNNGIFEGIRCDKIALIWSPKLKKFMYIALNDNYECYILFKSDNYHSLPNIADIELDNMNPSFQLVENINTLMNTVYKFIHDLTANPIIQYKTLEVFKRV
jgi:hypothetical protein